MRRVILEVETGQPTVTDITNKQLIDLRSLCPEYANLKPGKTTNGEEVLVKNPNAEGGFTYVYPNYAFRRFKKDGTPSNNPIGKVQVCQALKSKTTGSLGPDMQAVVDGLIAKDKSLKKIEDTGVKAGIAAGTYVPVDLNTLDKVNFPEPGKYFLYRQKGIGGTLQNIPNQVKTWLESSGWSLDEPEDIEMLKTRQPLLTVLQNLQGGTSLIPRLQGEMGVDLKNTFVYRQSITSLEGVGKLDDFRNAVTAIDGVGGEVDRQACRTVVKSLTKMSLLFRKNPKISQQVNSTDLNKIQDYAIDCSNKNFISGALGVGDELNKLKRDSSPFGLLKLVTANKNQANMNESVDDYLKRVIRTKLITLSESKKKSVISRKEFNNYIIQIDEAFNSLTPYKKRPINEDGLKDMLSGALGYGGEGILSYFKEKLANSIINKFVPGGSDTWLGGVISKTISNIKIGDYLNGNIFKCEFLVPQIAKGIGENAIDQFADKKGLTGGFYDVLRNSVVEVIDDVPFVKKLEDGIGTVLCPTLGKLGSALGGLFGNLGTELKQEFTPTK